MTIINDYQEPEFFKWIRAARKQQFEQTQGMSIEEKVAFAAAQIKEIRKHYPEEARIAVEKQQVPENSPVH